LFRKTPLKAQNDYISENLGGPWPLWPPLATPMCAATVKITRWLTGIEDLLAQWISSVLKFKKFCYVERSIRVINYDM